MGRQPLPTDTIIGNGSDQYRIDTVLGPGGFGVTYLARDLRFDRDVAVKEYFPADFAYREGSTTIRSTSRGGQTDFFEQGKRYFLEEARTLGKFRHPNIVRVINLFEQFNTAYMVLEFEEGQSLKHWLRHLGRRPSQEEIDRILEPMLDALALIHSKGMFHRDIAPDNIIIRPSGEPVLIDFGAARNFVRENSYTIGAIVKHGYSPPEQYTLDTKLQGAWSDIYSLCATLYFAIMGEPPEEASRRQLSDTMLPVERHLDGYHRGVYRRSLIRALDEGLALKPKERPQTIEAFRDLLERLEAEEQQRRDSHQTAAQTGRPPPAAARAPRQSAPDDGHSGTVIAAPTRETRVAALLSERPVPAAPEGVAGTGLDADAASYPEGAMRAAGMVALAVAAIAAAGFLMIGGIEHPGGLAAAMLVCGGLVGANLERTMALARADPAETGPAAVSAAVMSALALAIYWLPLFLWPFSLLLAATAGLFAWMRRGPWVSVTMLALAVLHLAIAGLLAILASRTQQKDPLFLPMMAVSLGLMSALMLASALQLRRRGEVASS